MSSTSSDFENSECFEFNNVSPWPMQPLVYYTSMPYHANQCRERKRNPNCFVKAFRWYTQERYPKKTDSMSTTAPEIKGFAVWLDQKYHEYIQDGGRSKYTLKKTSTLEIETKSNFPCESCGAKKMKTPKSPRKRHRKLTNSNGKALRSNKSFEILLYPKHTVSRTASECCQRGYSCCTYCPMTPKPRNKSQSLTSVLLEREVYQIPYDAIADKEAKKIIDTILDPNHAYEDSIPKTSEVGHKKNISCQCINAIVKLNASCQCTSRPNIKCDEKEITMQISGPKKLNQHCDAGTELHQKIHPVHAAFTNGTQTCDTPIQLPTQYPLFMRIICPDKL